MESKRKRRRKILDMSVAVAQVVSMWCADGGWRCDVVDVVTSVVGVVCLRRRGEEKERKREEEGGRERRGGLVRGKDGGEKNSQSADLLGSVPGGEGADSQIRCCVLTHQCDSNFKVIRIMYSVLRSCRLPGANLGLSCRAMQVFGLGLMSFAPAGPRWHSLRTVRSTSLGSSRAWAASSLHLVLRRY